MHKLDHASASLLDFLTLDLADPCRALPEGATSMRKFDRPEGHARELVVERIGERTFSVGTYFAQMGDRMSDPEFVFLRHRVGEWSVLALQQHVLGLRWCVGQVDEIAGTVEALDVDLQHKMGWWASRFLFSAAIRQEWSDRVL